MSAQDPRQTMLNGQAAQIASLAVQHIATDISERDALTFLEKATKLRQDVAQAILLFFNEKDESPYLDEGFINAIYKEIPLAVGGYPDEDVKAKLQEHLTQDVISQAQDIHRLALVAREPLPHYIQSELRNNSARVVANQIKGAAVARTQGEITTLDELFQAIERICGEQFNPYALTKAAKWVIENTSNQDMFEGLHDAKLLDAAKAFTSKARSNVDAATAERSPSVGSAITR